MGGSKTKAVGGQPVNPVASSYQGNLGQALQQGSNFQNTLNSLLSGTNQTGYMQSLNQAKDFSLPAFGSPGSTVDTNQNFSQSAPNGVDTSAQMQNSGINFLGLQGMGQQANLQDTSGLSQLLTSLGQQQFNFQPNQLNSQGTQNFNYDPNSLSGQAQNINFSPFQNQAQGQNVSINPNQYNFNPQQTNLAPNQFQAPNIQSSSPDINGSYANALQSIIQQQQQNDVNNLHQSFVNSGGAGQGTPGAYAEAVYRAQAAPQIASALGNLNLQENAQNLQAGGLNLQGAGLNLQNQQQNAQNYLQSVNQNNSANLQNQGLGLQNNQQNINALLQAASQNSNNAFNSANVNQANNALNLQGQLGAGSQNASNFFNQQGNQLQNSALNQQGQFNSANLNAQNYFNQQNLGLQNNAQNLQGLLGVGGLNLQGQSQQASNLLNSGNLTNQANQLVLSNQQGNRQIDTSQLANFLQQFNATNSANQQAGLQSAGLGLQQQQQGINVNQANQQALLQQLGLGLNQAQGLNQNQLATNQLNSSNAQAVQQNLLNVLGLQGNQNALNQQGQINALQQLFGGLNQTNQLGTPGAQIVQTPSGFQNFVNGFQGITAGIGNIVGAVRGK